jgi:hypothetical protein
MPSFSILPEALSHLELSLYENLISGGVWMHLLGEVALRMSWCPTLESFKVMYPPWGVASAILWGCMNQLMINVVCGSRCRLSTKPSSDCGHSKIPYREWTWDTSCYDCATVGFPKFLFYFKTNASEECEILEDTWMQQSRKMWRHAQARFDGEFLHSGMRCAYRVPMSTSTTYHLRIQ